MLDLIKKEKTKRILSLLAGILMIISSFIFVFMTGTWMTKSDPGTFSGFHSYLTTLEASILGEPKTQETEIAIDIVNNDLLRYIFPILSIFIVAIGEYKLTDRLLAVSLYSFSAILFLWFTIFILFSLMIPHVRIIYQ